MFGSRPIIGAKTLTECIGKSYTLGEAIVAPNCPDALRVDAPVPVSALPGFADGDVSVQDGSAQRVADALAPPRGARVLDACAAPGGKTGHLLELADAQVTALDADPRRHALEEALRLKEKHGGEVVVVEEVAGVVARDPHGGHGRAQPPNTLAATRSRARAILSSSG